MKKVSLVATVPDDFRKLSVMLFFDKYRADLDEYKEVAVQEKKSGAWVKVREDSSQARFFNACSDIFEGVWHLGKGLFFMIVYAVVIAFDGVRWLWRRGAKKETIFDDAKRKEGKR